MPTTVGRLSDTVADALLETLWRGAAFTAMPSTVHFGLSTTQPADDGTGITEPTDANYALIAVTRNTTNFGAASGRAITNAVTISYPASSTGGTGYGLIGWLPVWDDASRTNYLGYWVIDGGPESVGAGVQPQFEAGSLVWVAAGS